MQSEPSLKTQLGIMFRYLERDFNERMLYKHTKDLIGMMTSNRFRYTCAHRSWYKCVDQDKTRLHYEMHAARKCIEICTGLSIPIDSDFTKIILGYHIELFNVFFVKTKKEKIQINNRIRNLVNRIKLHPVKCEGYKVSSFLSNLKRDAINLLTDAVIASLN